MAATEISVDFCIGRVFFHFILELMSTTNSCADEPILLGDTLLPMSNWQVVCLAEQGGNAVKRVGPTSLTPGSSIFLVVFIFTLSPPTPTLIRWAASAIYRFPFGSTSLSMSAFFIPGTGNFAQTTLR